MRWTKHSNPLINHLRDFLIELGVGFAFVGSWYKLDIDGDKFYIDLLLSHQTALLRGDKNQKHRV